jgi:indolepyruvate ferredoxin oxidoreductase alpha subunit
VLTADDKPLAPQYLKAKAWPSGAASLSTEDLRRAFAPRLALKMLLNVDQLKRTIRDGIAKGVWIYYPSDEKIGYGSASAAPLVEISDDALLYTSEEAQRLGIKIKAGQRPAAGRWEVLAEGSVDVMGSGRRAFLTGNQALAWGAKEARVRVATGYPGTPCTEILEVLAEDSSVQAMWSTNEKVAVEVALGAALAGARALVVMKHVGLNVAADPLFAASYTGTRAGLVLVVGDDPSAHSSQNEQDSRHYARSAKLPLLEPADSQEVKDCVPHAFALSEQFATPVLVRLTTRVCHSRMVVEPGLNGAARDGGPALLSPGFVPDFDRYVLLPRQALERHAAIEERLERLADAGAQCPLTRVEWGSPELGIITAGACFGYVREAFPDASVLKLGQTYPLHVDTIRQFAARVRRLLVVEELDGFLEEQVEALGIAVQGKELFPRVGELDPERIRGSYDQGRPLPVAVSPVATRAPRICPGCQYLGVFTVIERLGVTVTGDIGCYTLGALPPFHSLDTVLCMGASIGMALGMEKALGASASSRVLAVIGDGTLLHSGLAPLLDLVYNHGHCTVLILDNSTTAMTGLQGHAGTGQGLQGRRGPGVCLEQLVRACGIDWVRVVDPYDLAATEQTLRAALAYPGPAVVISRSPCLLLKRHPPAQKARVNPDRCTGCGECFRVGCLAVESRTLDGRSVAAINAHLCVGCTLCVQTCPEGAIAPVPVEPHLLEITTPWQPTPPVRP